MSNAPAIIGLADWQHIEKAARILADTHALVAKMIQPGAVSMDFDRAAEEFIVSKNGLPAFKGYVVGNLAYPYTIQVSINHEVVHGMPSSKRVLKDGDIVSIDCGVKKNGFYADAAFSYAVGNISEAKTRLLQVTQESLMLGIEQAVENNKVYQIAGSIQRYVERHGFSLVRELTGHGIGTNLHEEPTIPNFIPALLHRTKYPNAKLRAGQALAIEPMVNSGRKEVVVDADGWTVKTKDGMPAAHFEHTVLVTKEKPIILTLQ
jgi:methionyl aminopeptidase